MTEQFAKESKMPEQKSPKPSKTSQWTWIPSVNVNTSLVSIKEVTLLEYGSKGELDKNQVRELISNHLKTNNPKVKEDLTFQFNRLEEKERHFIKQELDAGLKKIEEQLRSGVSEKQIIEAYTQGANANMKGVVTGTGCAVLVGLLVVAALSYSSKHSTKRSAGEDDNGDDFDDDWKEAARGSSVEQLEFAMGKLRNMTV
ncbi:uncharacterized protein Z519_01451 [Cladophialophora bantiana CBS 173.52]|uniref:Uncharacterized protein n=1 Tax=Cladophialophora bantiana (strain ATCC 10958 / CBS 173.52 / CDC B-1940 / NIH 8579) TaxID=1442370 RepID=A0A0D2GHM0_CLAB1|nr:uncharacterized protein Z519_01451 [Cladophialophora bantiana CBS 173.52]KIW97867.1 hypothetical protein Z519_01451 [Cladophialophora bantiana CBS 173.52]